MRTVLKVFVLGLLAAQLLLLWVALDQADAGAGVPLLPVTPVSEPVESLVIDTALPLTDSVALAWDPDARLGSAMMEVVWPNDAAVTPPTEVADGGAMTLLYIAGDRQLSLLMDRRSGVVFHAEAAEWSSGETGAIATSAITRSASIAVLAAEVSMGTRYRAECPEHRFVTRVYLMARVGESGNPGWLISYLDQRHRDRPDIEIVVDAVTGAMSGGDTPMPTCFAEES